MQSPNYQRTMIACFIAYMVQAVVNNFVPLLFVTFQQTYDIPMAKITLLITLNFLIQLVIDLLSAGFVDKIGYRASVILAHICAASWLCAAGGYSGRLPDERRIVRGHLSVLP